MKVIVAVIGLCYINHILAEEFVFEFDLSERDNDRPSTVYTGDRVEFHSSSNTKGKIENSHDLKKVKAKNKAVNNQGAKRYTESNKNALKPKVVNKQKNYNDNNKANAKKKKQSHNGKSLKDFSDKKDDPRKERDIGKKEQKTLYQGEHFPSKYLELDPSHITMESLYLYINSLNRTAHSFSNYLNETDVNVGLGLYMSSALLKHSVKSYGHKMNKELREDLKSLIKVVDNILSHYLSIHIHGQLKGPEYKVAQFLRDDSVISVSLNIDKIKKGQFTKWIFSDGNHMHDYVREMDEATLPKETYVTLVETMNLYHVNVDESDECIARLSSIPYPVPITGPMRRCPSDTYCEKALHSSPSVAYALSHRFLNVMFRRVHRRCYIRSEEFDEQHLQILCTNMYREAVYIARRGFFARDLFLEHIALCGLLGYEEFYRPSWFRKAASWVDDEGCTMEFKNFDLNRTKPIAGTDNVPRIRYIRTFLQKKCHHHLMALMLVVMSMGIRYTLHRLS